MTEITAETLKDKLKLVIHKQMRMSGNKKTAVVGAVATAVKTKPRQIYRWLKAEDFPRDPASIYTALDAVFNSNGTDKLKSDIRAPSALSSTHTSFPFQVTIPRRTLKVTQDEHGNITIHGSLSLDLL